MSEYIVMKGEKGPWEECISDYMDMGSSQEEAVRICGLIRNRYRSEHEKDDYSLLVDEHSIKCSSAIGSLEI